MRYILSRVFDCIPFSLWDCSLYSNSGDDAFPDYAEI